jgi:uncharacterized protein (TIGR02145 family)
MRFHSFHYSYKDLSYIKQPVSVRIIIIFILAGACFLGSCRKDPTLPVLTTDSAMDITTSSATISGEITDDGGASITVRGLCWGESDNPEMEGSHTDCGTGPGVFSCTVSGLDPNKLYHARAYAINTAGIAYGNDIVFTTSAAVPELTTAEISGIALNIAVSGGNISSDGGAPVTTRGVCWSTEPDPDINDPFVSGGTGTGSFTCEIKGLSPGSRYYVRAFAQNKGGIAYGNQIIFNTNIADADGNQYRTVTIGTQVWMAENLRTTKLNDNSPLPNVTVNAEWISFTAPAYCWYNNDIVNESVYGALYNWYTAKAASVCPSGWHVPTDEEFATLEQYLGIPADQLFTWGWRGTDQGTKLKDTTGWDTGGNGTNESGFSALPGGYRYGATGEFFLLTSITYWWSSTEHDADRGWYRRLDTSNGGTYRASTSKKGGKYIRCLKN